MAVHQGGSSSISGGSVTLSGGVVTVDSSTPVNVIANASTNIIGATALAPDITNPTSTLQGTSATTAYSAGQLVANSSVAGSVTVPSFTMAGGGGVITKLGLYTNDTAASSWGGQTVQVDLWRAAPTFGNGDRGAYSVASGMANQIASFSGTFGTKGADGVVAMLVPNSGVYATVKLASGTTIYWSELAVSGSGTTMASAVQTLTAEILG